MTRLDNKKQPQTPTLPKGIFQISDAVKLGLPRYALSRMTKEGKLRRLGPGIYVSSESEIDPEYFDFIVGCMLCGPKAAVGGITALFHYQLIEEVPDRTWMVAPPEVRSPNRKYRVIRTTTKLNHGIAAENGFRIVTPERAILEALRHKSKIGERIAISAARKAIFEKKIDHKKLFKVAKKLGLLNVLHKYWEIISTP